MPLPSRFPLLETHAPRPARLQEALALLRQGVDAGAMRKAEHDEVKQVLGRAVEKVWEVTVSDPHFYAGRYAAQGEEANRLHRECNHSSLHDMISTWRKLRKSSCDDPPVCAMRALADEIYPIAAAMADLKGYLIAGRASPVRDAAQTQADPARPDPADQTRGTCSCCFRSIAVQDTGRMAHHGYQRPGLGLQTSSCAGIRFPPLETSLDGLEWLIEETRATITRSETALAGKQDLDRLTVLERRGRITVPRAIEKGDPGFPAALRNWEAEQRMTIAGGKRGLEMFGETLDRWRQWHHDRAPEAAPSP